MTLQQLHYILTIAETGSMNKAAELMCETDLPISDVIAAVGYENGSYFHRVFKERYNMTPRAFRVANKKSEKVRL